jgi:predicted lipoprotein with Yx(FWY)xxD motif
MRNLWSPENRRTKGRQIRRRTLLVSGLGAVAIFVAACSSSSNSASSTTQPSTSSVTGGSSAVVKAVTVPTYGLILTNSSGMPLYTLSGSCTGACASAWPALTVPGSTQPTGGTGVTGTLRAVKQADGSYHVTYNGSPLYTFVQDSSDHVTGQGVSGFSVVKVSGSATPTGSTTSTTSRSGY